MEQPKEVRWLFFCFASFTHMQLFLSYLNLLLLMSIAGDMKPVSNSCLQLRYHMK